MKVLIVLMMSLMAINEVSSRTEGSLELIAITQSGELEDRFESECQRPENMASCKDVLSISRQESDMDVASINNAFEFAAEQLDQMFVVLINRFIQGSESEGFVKMRPDSESVLRELDISLKTYIIMHGWLQDVDEIRKHADAILAAEQAQIIGVDWSQLATGKDYFRSCHNVYRVAEYVGRFATFLVQKELIKPSNVHVVGHSMGCVGASQIASVIWRETGEKVERATGLDCARPYFKLFPRSRRMNPDVANIVDVVHTNGGENILDGSAGELAPLGHLDFYVSGGQIQPKCRLIKCDINDAECNAAINGCSHVAALEYFFESYTPGAEFVGQRCRDQSSFDNCDCEQVFASIGKDLDAKSAKNGKYYLDANAERPFARGKISCGKGNVMGVSMTLILACAILAIRF